MVHFCLDHFIRWVPVSFRTTAHVQVPNSLAKLQEDLLRFPSIYIYVYPGKSALEYSAGLFLVQDLWTHSLHKEWISVWHQCKLPFLNNFNLYGDYFYFKMFRLSDCFIVNNFACLWMSWIFRGIKKHLIVMSFKPPLLLSTLFPSCISPRPAFWI